MKMRASGWGGFLLRMVLAAAILVVLCRLGMRMMPTQNLRLTLIALFSYSVACGVFAHGGGLASFRRRKSEEPAKVETGTVEEPAKVETVTGKVEEQGGEVEGPGQGPGRNCQPANMETREFVEPEIQEPTDSESLVPGEAEYLRARAMKRQPIPDYRVDGHYLDMLGKSANKGYAQALVKLGEYAMRREAWVEAYYWMWRAQRSGMSNFEPVLRGICRCWVMAGCPSEDANVYDLFDEECGSVGRALLGVASGHNAADAREFLTANYPEFLVGGTCA